jgi:hypothetical protein
VQCFSHRDLAAVGICRSCGKGLCPGCAREVERGIVCSDPCADHASTQLAIVERAKRVYSIGERPRIPIASWLFGVLGAFLLGGAVLVRSGDSSLWQLALVCGVFGVTLCAFAVFYWRRYRAVGLNL